MLVVLHALLCGWQLIECENLVDQGRHAAIGQHGQQVALQRLRCGNAVRQIAHLVGHAEQLQALAVQRAEVDARVDLADDVSNKVQPRLEAHGLDACGKNTAADGVHHQVHPLILSGLHDGWNEVGRAGVQRDIEAQRLEAFEFFQ